MLDATAHWSLSSIVIALLIGNFVGGMALTLGLPLLRDALRLGPSHPVRSRVEGVLLTALGLAGWVVPWIVIVHWFRSS